MGLTAQWILWRDAASRTSLPPPALSWQGRIAAAAVGDDLMLWHQEAPSSTASTPLADLIASDDDETLLDVAVLHGAVLSYALFDGAHGVVDEYVSNPELLGVAPLPPPKPSRLAQAFRCGERTPLVADVLLAAPDPLSDAIAQWSALLAALGRPEWPSSLDIDEAIRAGASVWRQ
jgi:hypothetical protein